MDVLIGTSEGVFVAGASGRPAAANGIDGRNVRALHAANGSILAGADTGVFRSGDRGRAWEPCGVDGKIVWDIATAPRDPSQVYVGTQPSPLR